MPYFFAAGLCIDVPDEWGRQEIEDFLRRTRWFYQQHRDAKEAGDFGGIVKWEHYATGYAQWWRDTLAAWGGDAGAIERFIEAERRYIYQREERCGQCDGAVERCRTPQDYPAPLASFELLSDFAKKRVRSASLLRERSPHVK